MLVPRKGDSRTSPKTMTSYFESTTPNNSADFVFSSSTSRISIPGLPSISSHSSRADSRGAESGSNSPGNYYSLFSSTSLNKPLTTTSNSNADYTLPPPQPKSYPAYGQVQPDQRRQHQGHDLSQQMQGMRIASSMPVDPLDSILGQFQCARVRGLPYDANFEDICMLFQGLVLLDIVLPMNAYGSGTGEAFGLFGNPSDYQAALVRSGQIRPGCFVEVFPARRNDYHAAISSNQHVMNVDHHNNGEGEGHRAQMRGNQWNAGANMASMPPQPQMRHPQMHPHQHQHQIQHQHQHQIQHQNANQGGYKLPVATGNQNTGTYKGSRPGRGDGRSKGGGGRGTGRGGGIQVGEHTGFLRMRGLPFTTTKKEIFDFFNDYGPIEDSICLTYRSDGRATGEGYIVFKSSEDAKNAMSLHRESMGSRYIELFISNKDEHARALAREPREE